MFWLIEMWKLIGKHVPRDGVALIGGHVVAYWLICRSTLRCGGSHWWTCSGSLVDICGSLVNI